MGRTRESSEQNILLELLETRMFSTLSSRWSQDWSGEEKGGRGRDRKTVTVIVIEQPTLGGQQSTRLS